MPLEDLRAYQKFTARRKFPGRRLELLLAQVSMVLAQVHGNKDARLVNFLFDPPPDEEPDDEPDADAVASALNFTPRQRPPRQDQTGDLTDGKQPG